MNDTIVAISTALGVGAISIVRLSGKDAINIVNKAFKGKNLNNVPSHSINHGYILENGETIDEVLVSVMKSPKTFTMEDIVEINCHGGIAITNKILELMLLNGARLAEPGEFTKRAFLNGKMDLIEAGAVMDIINSKTEKARVIAANQLSGKVSSMINKLRSNMLSIISNVEVNIDYPEYEDILVVTNDMIKNYVFELDGELSKILMEAENGKLIKEGIKTVIIGRPNVGKSSILNKLLDEDKAIVTDVAGTTRDIVEGTFTLNGVLFNVIDTAGIRLSDDEIESEGIRRSYEKISSSDLALFLIDSTADEQQKKESLKYYDKYFSKGKTILCLTKSDIANHSDNSGEISGAMKISIYDDKSIENLKRKMTERFIKSGEDISPDRIILTNMRHKLCLEKVISSLEASRNSIESKMSGEFISLDLRAAIISLGEITGEFTNDEVLNNIFSKFCIGK